MDYNNPTSALPNPNEFASNNFLQVANAQDRMAIAQPFLQMAAQKQGLGLAEDQAKFQEFMSPEAKAARFSAFGKASAENNAAARVAGPEADAKIAKARADIEALPFMTEQKIEEAKAAAMKARGGPAAKLYNDLGNIYDGIIKLPEAARPIAYQNAIQRWQAENPGAKLPPQLAQYNPQDLAQIRYAQLNTPEFTQRTKEKQMEVDQHKYTADTNANAHIRGAQIAAGATMGAARIRSEAEKPVAPGVRITQLRKELAKNPGNEEAQQELKYHLEGEFIKSFQKNPMAGMLAVQAATGDEKALARYKAFEAESKATYMSENGIGVKTGSDRVRVKDKNGKIGTIPKSQLEAAKAAGYEQVQ